MLGSKKRRELREQSEQRARNRRDAEADIIKSWRAMNEDERQAALARFEQKIRKWIENGSRGNRFLNAPDVLPSEAERLLRRYRVRWSQHSFPGRYETRVWTIGDARHAGMSLEMTLNHTRIQLP